MEETTYRRHLTRLFTAQEIVRLADEHGEDLSPEDVILVPYRCAQASSRWDAQFDLSIDVRGEKVREPIILAPMDTVTCSKVAIAMHEAGGLSVIHRNFADEGVDENLACAQIRACAVAEYQKANVKGAKPFMSVGVGQEKLLNDLLQVGCRRICIETANGWHDSVIDFADWIRKQWPDLLLMGGNVADPEGAVELGRRFDFIRIGIGPGAGCITRLVAGVGRGQFTNIVECVHALSEEKLLARDRTDGRGTYTIADGGLAHPGDFLKVLAVVDFAMAGHFFAGCEETPGEVIERRRQKVKIYRGMSSASVSETMRRKHAQGRKVAAEGVETLVPYRGLLKDRMDELLCGIHSGMSYFRVKNRAELWEYARFRRMTPSAVRESQPRLFQE